MNRNHRRIPEKNVKKHNGSASITGPLLNFDKDECLRKVVELGENSRFYEAAFECKNYLEHCPSGHTSETVASMWARWAPENPSAWNYYGITLLNNDKSDDALACFEKALSIKETAYEVLPFIAAAWHKKGNLKKARSYLNSFFNHKNLTGLSAVREHIRLLTDEGYTEAALKEALNLSKKMPDDIFVNHILAMIYGNMQMPDEAAYHMQKVLEIAPDEALYHFQAAEYYDETGRKEADFHYKKSAELFDKNSGRMYTGFEREKNISYASAGISDIPVKISSVDSMDSLNDNLPYLIGKRSVGNSREMIMLKDSVVPADEWIILHDDTAYCDMLMTDDEKFLIKFKDAKRKVILNTDASVYTFNEPVILMGGASNYYHWLCDYLPRLEIIAACPDLNNIPIVINSDIKDFQRESLKALGYDLSRFISAPKSHYLYFKDGVYIPHIKNRPLNKNGQIDLFTPALSSETLVSIRKLFTPLMEKNQKFPKRIFISRKNARFRRCINEDIIYSIARDYGFEKIENENMSFTDQISLYAGAEAVIGPHGAGFANMIFAPEKAKLIELSPMNALPSFFKNICSFLNQRHISVEGPRTDTLGITARQLWDFEVSTADVRKALDEL